MSSGGHGGGGLPGLGFVQNLMHGAHGEGGYSPTFKLLLIAFAVENLGFFLVAPMQAVANFSIVVFLLPLWMPYFLFKFGLFRFIEANKAEFIAKQKHVLLEIRMPRDTRRTPLAMETVFSSMHIGGGENTWYKRIIRGQVRPWYSYEIVSIGGQIHFYAWMRESLRRPFESFFYAQYPDVQIIEAMDYSRLVDPSHAPYTMTAFEYGKGKADPYPIKTYPEYGLDQVKEPEETIDPLAQVLELMGSLGPKEQLWMQFVVRIHRGEKYRDADPNCGPRTWKDEAKEVIAALRQESKINEQFVDPNGATINTERVVNPTRAMGDRIDAVERNTGKLAYDVGIRGIYLAPEDAAHAAMGGMMVNFFKPFNSEQHNQLGPIDGRWSNHFNDYPWEDPHGHHQAHMDHEVVQLYRQRAFYHIPYVGQYHTMSTEELATLFHVPSAAIKTPGLPRIQSTTSEAPGNLPL